MSLPPIKSSDNIAMIIDAPDIVAHFTIPGRLPGYNELTVGHWAARGRVKQAAKDKVAVYIRQTRIQPIAGKVTVEIRCYEPNRRRDCDNVTSGAAKVILDALQACG
ncbi:RusA family crossover junction endodeoxyribonuclease, partial [Ruminococcaceae bacterium OttesenSCG-928-I18]|nr:RusA family crossover junction endodeoxyribonuclease [Ruminococcaceae bacterium OttesenSCG-928-I18]